MLRQLAVVLAGTQAGTITDKAMAPKSKTHSKAPSHSQISKASQRDERCRDQVLQKLCDRASKEKSSALDKYSKTGASDRLQCRELSPEGALD